MFRPSPANTANPTVWLRRYISLRAVYLWGFAPRVPTSVHLSSTQQYKHPLANIQSPHPIGTLAAIRRQRSPFGLLIAFLVFASIKVFSPAIFGMRVKNAI